MTLAMGETGGRYRISGIAGGRRLESRLTSLGIFPGVEVTIVSDNTSGPCIVGVRGSRVVLGRGIAAKLLVEAVDEDTGKK